MICKVFMNSGGISDKKSERGGAIKFSSIEGTSGVSNKRTCDKIKLEAIPPQVRLH